MADATMFNREQDTSIFGRLLYSQPEKPRFVVTEEKAPYLIRSTGTVYNPELLQLEEMFMKLQQIASYAREFSELDVPDIFTLRPLATQQITLQITEIKPARFYYVPDVDDDEE